MRLEEEVVRRTAQRTVRVRIPRRTVRRISEALAFASEKGFPIRVSSKPPLIYHAIVNNRAELTAHVTHGLALSPVKRVLLQRIPR